MKTFCFSQKLLITQLKNSTETSPIFLIFCAIQQCAADFKKIATVQENLTSVNQILLPQQSRK